MAQLAADHPEIAEIDVNPLLVAGTQLVAADALVILAEPRGAPQAGGADRAMPRTPRRAG